MKQDVKIVGDRFRTGYLILGIFFGALVTSLIISAHKPIQVKYPLQPITNHSSPADIEKHFSSHPLATFPGNSQGVDGTCWGYSNKSSWIATYCYGGINTG